ncbi:MULTISPECIES: ATP-binding protein [Thermomonospora]|uniref:Putative anti-sigma regulatory factor, serine/threonine protein kinase n=1 Tax=Thermomonospora curvata (strain ATCC 19995 / DSM 43183 / JCM 3096 / KCTC 9072 / NBRC 15933 / NCIMB 10081 / Henssen B9) TaxID=471852 RepID=D1A1J5_THECD|nr:MULTISPECIES: ATP-binding protein [Thermomonospora]ACY95917.1 putative anti-sigma regulatory factor, serine/threonine protein kinase [Thermomonospora curvata DSM 43183]PKK16161.1 MAG: ATP-binding protein [Thermomonospora sp. CIF 1]
MGFSLALPRESLSIRILRRVLGDALRGLGVAEDCIGDILVAASEACTNVVQHSRTPLDYEVIARVNDGVCALTVTDHGRGLTSGPAAGDPEQAESGRGIKIMHALMDDVTFDTRPGYGTAVHMSKRLTWKDEAPLRRLQGDLVHSAR